MASWGKITYSNRLFLWLLGYSILLVACVLFFQYRRETEFKAEELNVRLQMLNETILQKINSGKFEAEDLVSGEFPDLRISIIDLSGKVIYDNSLDSLPNSNHLSRKEIAKAFESGSGYTVRRHSESTGDTYFYSARKGNDGIIVRTAVPYSVSLHTLLKADRSFIWFLGIVTVVMCTMGFFATRRVGLLIQRLRNFAEKAEKGDRIYDTEPFPHDELGEIANHIVRLYASLQRAVSERDKEHSAALHEQQEKERIKKQLTNNINHELKTPVASIRVCLETLMTHPDMTPEKRNEFLARCFANNERLQQLLADVSVITRLDDGAHTIAKEQIDLTEIIETVVTERSSFAQQQGFTIRNHVNNPIIMQGNRALLESVFYNLIDNAISYSSGNLIIIKQLPSIDSQITITLSDNGMGVDEIHLSRLFERFYRVDKGRSRAAGGTGLGLSIVKNVINLHKGTITVSNQPDGGLIFKICLICG